MRAGALPLAVALVLSGCLGLLDRQEDREVEPFDPGHDAAAIRVSGVQVWETTVAGFGNASLSVVVHEPRTRDAFDGEPPSWPVVVFIHGWGQSKEAWQRASVEDGPVDLLDRFARKGFITVAYDTRGFGRSQGDVTVAGPAEMADLARVLDFVEATFPTNGRVGVTGVSYGGGHAYLAWAGEPRVDTVVAHQGWVDLADALLPGRVPKLEWAQALYAAGQAGSGARLHPMVTEWYLSAYTRAEDPQALATTEAQLGLRSMQDRLGATQRPLLVCQGMHESLFPQADAAWTGAGGFTRAVVHAGGHGATDAGCWERTLDWFLFFLRGIDTQVDAWPALATVDARDASLPVATWTELPTAEDRVYGLRAPDLTLAVHSNVSFKVEQRLLANPLHDPAFLADVAGVPPAALPAEMREDPAGVMFRGAPLDARGVLFGAPHLRLVPAGEPSLPFQVAATLYVEGADGQSQILARGAAAALEAADLEGGVLDVRFHWLKADLAPGDALVLKVAANDPSWWMPLLADYETTFTGESRLAVPFLVG